MVERPHQKVKGYTFRPGSGFLIRGHSDIVVHQKNGDLVHVSTEETGPNISHYHNVWIHKRIRTWCTQFIQSKNHCTQWLISDLFPNERAGHLSDDLLSGHSDRWPDESSSGVDSVGHSSENWFAQKERYDQKSCCVPKRTHPHFPWFNDLDCP